MQGGAESSGAKPFDGIQLSDNLRIRLVIQKVHAAVELRGQLSRRAG